MAEQSHMLVRDVETRGTVDLRDVGQYNYATHRDTQMLCVGYCVDDGPVKLWWPGDPVPDAYREAARNPNWTAVAHQAPFEMAIERHILGPRHGFPIIPLNRNLCTMAVARSLALPASLGKLAMVLRCQHQKDAIGSRLMLQLSKPRKRRKHEPENGHAYWFEDDERLIRLGEYCKEDVEATREIAYQLPWLSDDEYAIWLLDQKINDRGIYIDHKLALAAQQIVQDAGPYIDQEISRITDCEVTSINQVAKLKAWLSQYCDATSLNKAAIEELLAQNNLHPLAREAIKLRAFGAQAAPKKIESLLARRSRDGRVHDAFVYHAAGPGRWSSHGAQLHNMKRSSIEDVEQVISVISGGDFDAANAVLENPLATIGDLIRAMIVAMDEHRLIGADFSGIEARITAWYAGEESKLEVFRKFDAGLGPDPYIKSAAAVLSLNVDKLQARYLAGDIEARNQRQVGKRCELAFGFQGRVDAFRKASQWNRRHGLTRDMDDFLKLRKLKPSGDPVKDQETIDREIEKVNKLWREAHPRIQAMWSTLNNAAWRATRNPGKAIRFRDKLVFEHDGSSLWITLPSGRRIHYPETRIRRIIKKAALIIETPKGFPALIFKDNVSGQWRDTQIYGGLLTENVVQGMARDLLALAMLRIEAAGMPIVAHVHDEAICEVRQDQVKRLKPQFQNLMVASPSWAEGLPIVAKAWSDSRYVK